MTRIGSERTFAFGKPLCSTAYEKAIPSSGLLNESVISV